MRDVLVAYPPGRGVPWWEELGRASGVPGGWPYGLEQLGAGDLTVGAREAPRTGRLDRWAAVLGRRPAGSPRPSDRAPVALCWDERTAPALAAARLGVEQFCGVIWATDRLAAGETAGLSALRRVLRSMSGVWCLSAAQVAATADWLGADGPPVHHVPFGIDTDFYRSAPFPVPGVPRVVSMGRDRDRDPATLLQALRLVRDDRPAVRGTVQSSTGQPPPPGVDVVPAMSHRAARELIASASVVAVATRPNLHVSGVTVALEAMSTGRPVVLSDTPGMSDYVEHGVTGLLVPPGDPAALAEAIASLVDDPDRAAVMGARGRAAVERSFSTTVMCQRLRELTGARSPRAPRGAVS